MTFTDFKQQVEHAGMSALRCSDIHWQIWGGRYMVNYYPTTGTIYRNGTYSGAGCRQRGSIERAIALANEVPTVKRRGRAKSARPSSGKARRLRRRLLQTIGHCHWCGCPLDEQSATLEHIIPLARGGSNGMDNLTLACRPCNAARGHDMPEQNPN